MHPPSISAVGSGAKGKRSPTHDRRAPPDIFGFPETHLVSFRVLRRRPRSLIVVLEDWDCWVLTEGWTG